MELRDTADSRLPEDLIWLRRFAERLARDPGLADDACQEAWLSAKRAAGREGDGSRLDRGSLIRSLKSALFRRRRSETRRRWHEAQGARPAKRPSTAELLMQGERCEALWRHVRDLEEPVRSTLLFHYGEGTSIPELAEHLGVTEDTVRWRLRKGRARLRVTLEGSGEHRALALLAVGSVPARSLFLPGTLIMWKLTSAIAAVALGAVWLAGSGGSAHSDATDAQELAGTLPLEPEMDRLTAVPRPEATVTEPGAEAGDRTPGGLVRDPSVAAEEGLTAEVTARIVDEQGRGIAGAEVTVTQDSDWEISARSAGDGTVSLSCPRQDEGRVTILVEHGPFYQPKRLQAGTFPGAVVPPLNGPQAQLGKVVLSSAGGVRGTLLNAAGQPLEGAKVYRVWSRHIGETAADGRFEIMGLRPGEMTLSCVAPGYLASDFTFEVVPNEIHDAGEISSLPGESVRGRVLDLEGRPVADALIALTELVSPDSSRSHRTGRANTRSSGDGSFELSLDRPGPQAMCAIAKGYRPGLAVEFEPGAFVELRVAPLGSVARFRIVDRGSGAPIEHARLSLAEPRKASKEPLGANRPRVPDPRPEGSEPLPPGTIEIRGMKGRDRLRARAAGYESLSRSVTSAAFSERGQRVALKPKLAVAVTGRVVNEGGPLPYANVRLEFLSVGQFGYPQTSEWRALESTPEALRDYPEVKYLYADLVDEIPIDHVFLSKGSTPLRTDAEGRFHADVPVGQLLRAVAPMDPQNPSGIVGVSDVVRARAQGEPLELGDLKLVATSTVYGQITGLDESNLAQAKIIDRVQHGQRLGVSPDGKFHLGGLLPGPYVVRAMSRSFPSRDQILLLQPGETKHWIVRGERAPVQSKDITLRVNGVAEERFHLLFVPTVSSAEESGVVWAHARAAGAASAALIPDTSYVACLIFGEGGGVTSLFQPNGLMVVTSGSIVEIPGTWEFSSFEGPLEVAVDTGALELSFARESLPAAKVEASLTFSTDRGPAMAPIRLGTTISRDRQTAEPTNSLLATFPSVPTGARDLMLHLTDADDKTQTSSWPVSVKVQRATTTRIAIDG